MKTKLPPVECSSNNEWIDMAGKLANCLRHACDAGLRQGSVMDEADATLLAYRRLLDKPAVVPINEHPDVDFDDSDHQTMGLPGQEHLMGVPIDPVGIKPAKPETVGCGRVIPGCHYQSGNKCGATWKHDCPSQIVVQGAKPEPEPVKVEVKYNGQTIGTITNGVKDKASPLSKVTEISVVESPSNPEPVAAMSPLMELSLEVERQLARAGWDRTANGWFNVKKAVWATMEAALRLEAANPKSDILSEHIDVAKACEEWAELYQKWSNGKGNYPSTASIMRSMKEAGLLTPITEVSAVPTVEKPEPELVEIEVGMVVRAVTAPAAIRFGDAVESHIQARLKLNRWNIYRIGDQPESWIRDNCEFKSNGKWVKPQWLTTKG